MENKVKKYKGSKKSKRSWKKADIDDVEETLEDQRRDERIGVTDSHRTSDENLFFIDTKVEEKFEYRKPGRAKRKSTDADDASDDDEEEYVSRKQKLKMKLEEENKKEKKKYLKENNKDVDDIWKKSPVETTDAYLEPTVKKKKKMPDTMKEITSEVAAVEIPAPGASYNPDYDAHQELLLEAHREELSKWKENKKLNEKVKMLSVEELKKLSKTWLKEMSEGIIDSKEDNIEDENKIQNETDEVEKQDKQRKTKRQKRLEKVLKKKTAIKDVEKMEKMKQHDLTRLKRLTSDIKKEEELSKKKSKLRQQKQRQLASFRAKTLSKHKYKAPPVAVQISEELSGTLRELKPEGSLLEDRFKSFQKRNIIETRKKVIPHRKFKKKTIVKRSYKTETIRDFKSKR